MGIRTNEMYDFVFSGDPCIPQPCQNGGRCRSDIAAQTYVCDCPTSYIGTNCETSEFFVTFYCFWRKLLLWLLSWTIACTCLACSLNLLSENPCASNPCQNGGTCRNNNGAGYQCICAPGTSGMNCENRKLVKRNRKIEWWLLFFFKA